MFRNLAKAFLPILLLSQVILTRSIEIDSYAKVSRSGSSTNANSNQLNGSSQQIVDTGNSTVIEK
jgi:hypothetical protein